MIDSDIFEEQKKKQRYYQTLFKPRDKKISKNAEYVLRDLARFCDIGGDTPYLEPFQLAQMEGRRQVFNYIMKILHTDLNQFNDELENIIYD